MNENDNWKNCETENKERNQSSPGQISAVFVVATIGLGLLGLALLSGCATVAHGTDQTLTFDKPCEVYRGGVKIGEGKQVIVRRSSSSLRVTCGGVESNMQARQTPECLASIPWDGSMIDRLTGACYEYVKGDES